jgi:putative holliday junction resolvase
MTAQSGRPPGRIMAFDFGKKRIGVAVSDEGRVLAQAVATVQVKAKAPLLPRLLDLIVEYGPTELLVGFPLNMDGSEGPSARASAAFAGDLGAASGLAVSLWDERLTTAWAERSLIEQDFRRKKRREVIDQVAAVLLLQGYLDRQRGGDAP